jgi:hypothetical protein
MAVEPCNPWARKIALLVHSDIATCMIFQWFPMYYSMHYVPSGPSGKHTKNDGKSPCFMGKSPISMAIFNSKVLVFQLEMTWTLRSHSRGLDRRCGSWITTTMNRCSRCSRRLSWGDGGFITCGHCWSLMIMIHNVYIYINNYIYIYSHHILSNHINIMSYQYEHICV